MASYNKVFLMGNITRDIEVRQVAGGQSIARIGLAVNRKFTTQSGERREEVTFVDCDAWGKTAETMAKYLAKGRPVFIEGRLKLEQWEDKSTGEKRSALRVVVEGFQFIDSRGADTDSDGQPSPQRSGPRPSTASSGPAPAAPEGDMGEDIPF